MKGWMGERSWALRKENEVGSFVYRQRSSLRSVVVDRLLPIYPVWPKREKVEQTRRSPGMRCVAG